MGQSGLSLTRRRILALILVFIVGWLVHPKLANRYVAPRRYLRVIAPTTKELLDVNDKRHYNLMMCKALVTNFALGYPSPILTNFNVSFSGADAKMISGGTHLAKIDGVRNYLNSLEPQYDNDVVFFYDVTDTWIQLPPEILISRYLKLLASSSSRLASQYGQSTIENAGISSKVFFSAQKGCGLNGEQGKAKGCFTAPESSLPDDIFGPLTDKDAPPPERMHVYRRPRWVNSGFAIGTVSAMRKVYERAYEMAHHGYGNIGSDQYIINEIIGQQEVWRRFQAERHEPNSERPYSPVRLGTTVGRSTIKVPDWHDVYELDPETNYEFGIELDDGSTMAQVAWSFEKELDYVQHDEPEKTIANAEKRKIDPPLSLLDWAPDMGRLAPPLQSLSLTPQSQAQTSLGESSDLTWQALNLVRNLYTGQIPVMVHMCGLDWKAKIDKDWKRTWFYPYIRPLLAAAGDRSTNDPVAVVSDPYGRKQTWYARTEPLSIETDRPPEDGPRYATFDQVCGTHWKTLIGDGKDLYGAEL